jgi:hypothetical protein
MEKSVLELVGGEKHINPHYDIKAESTSCYPVGESFTGIEINGVRFSNIGEMLRYMDKQRDQLTKAKELIRALLPFVKRPLDANIEVLRIKQNAIADAEQFIKENE